MMKWQFRNCNLTAGDVKKTCVSVYKYHSGKPTAVICKKKIFVLNEVEFE